ncbi:oxidoreductase [Pseudomonas sp. WN033]|nr:oxidoreductase [Pseudomonas sp. WN033]
MSQEQRTLWVVGASTGIGAALVDVFHRAGWRVALSARRAELLRQRAAQDPERLFAVPVDVTDLDAMHQAVAAIEAHWGEIDTAILNAGDYEPMALDDFSPALFARLMQVNYIGVVHGLDALQRRMRERKRGQIMITASVAGYRGLPYAAPYGATKAALISLAESLQPEFARDGVRLRLICPGFVRTPLTDKNDFPMPGLTEPAQVAAAVLREVDGRRFEILVPRGFGWLMKGVRSLPYLFWLPLARRMLRNG